MRAWVHTIWGLENNQVCKTIYRDDQELERLIKKFGDEVMAIAWALYVFEDPAPYHLEPVKHVIPYTTKAGKPNAWETEDESKITRFPLAAFLAVREGYIVKAMIIANNKDERERYKYVLSRANKGYRLARSGTIGVAESWGEAPEENGE